MNLTKCILLLLLGIATLLGAEAAEAKEKSGTFSFYFENDLFADTDQGYTNGTKLSWVSPDLTGYAQSDNLPEWALPYIRRLPFINEPGLQRNIALCMGQNIYTPEDISREDLIEDDRPYAGWAYFGIAFHSKDERRLDTIEIQLGMVGPASFAEQTQIFVHGLRDIQRPNGWDNQLKNEPGLAFIYERKLRLFQGGINMGAGFDVIGHLGVTLGNIYTYANTGMEARTGWNIPTDFGDATIRPAGDTNSPTSTRDPRLSGKKGFGLYVFSAVSGRVVLRDIFLDGNTFTDSHSVDKKYFVADVSAGVSLIIYRFKLSYAHVFRSKEFYGQKGNPSFGSITLSFSW
jgi:hypothetical protein